MKHLFSFESLTAEAVSGASHSKCFLLVVGYRPMDGFSTGFRQAAGLIEEAVDRCHERERCAAPRRTPSSSVKNMLVASCIKPFKKKHVDGIAWRLSFGAEAMADLMKRNEELEPSAFR